MRFYRPTWAEINLNNLAHNFRQVRRLLPAQVKIMVTVKADAYGHGLIPVSKRLVAEGVDFLGVASIDEGIILRRAGINVPVLILGLILKQDISPLFEYSLTPTVCDTAFAKALDAKARKTKVRLCVHLKIDTGMGRIGVLHEDAEGLIRNVAALTHIELTGLFTHFAFADMDKKFTEHQIKLFNRLVVHLAKTG
ncbi:MAG: alanine racemase, partial [Candidatus Omnitrophica bacterium]|nr:alanine racemase [Candidatus Omnitrophota bacterium]